MLYLTDPNPVLSAKVNDHQTLAEVVNDVLDRQRRITAALVEAVKQAGDAVSKLRAAGFNASINQYCDGYFGITVKREELTRVYKALGRLRKLYHNLDDAKKRTVRVTLKPENYDQVYIHYITKLPKGKRVKCKIVRKRVTQAQLVCEL